MNTPAPTAPQQDLARFEFNNLPVRIVQIDGEPWFVAKDVCDVLEIQNAAQAVGQLDDDERGISTVDTLGGSQRMATINEPGLYSLILRSRKPEAKAFKRWVTHEVLPSIRKTGGYGIAPQRELTRDELLSRAILEAHAVMDEQKRQIEAQQAIKSERTVALA